MKKNDFASLKGSDNKELILKVKALRQELADLVLDKNMKKMKDQRVIFKKRKDLAQVLTVLRQKQILQGLESKIANQQLSKQEKKEEGNGSKARTGQSAGKSKSTK